MLEYVGFPKIWGRFVQLQVPHKFYCAPAPVVRNLGARAAASSMVPAPMKAGCEESFVSGGC